MTSARGLREKVESLLLDELWDSAETLGGLLATSTGVDGCHPGERAAHVALFADALLGKREFRRALHHYARAEPFLTAFVLATVSFPIRSLPRRRRRGEVGGRDDRDGASSRFGRRHDGQNFAKSFPFAKI